MTMTTRTTTMMTTTRVSSTTRRSGGVRGTRAARDAGRFRAQLRRADARRGGGVLRGGRRARQVDTRSRSCGSTATSCPTSAKEPVRAARAPRSAGVSRHRSRRGVLRRVLHRLAGQRRHLSHGALRVGRPAPGAPLRSRDARVHRRVRGLARQPRLPRRAAHARSKRIRSPTRRSRSACASCAARSRRPGTSRSTTTIPSSSRSIRNGATPSSSSIARAGSSRCSRTTASPRSTTSRGCSMADFNQVVPQDQLAGALRGVREVHSDRAVLDVARVPVRRARARALPRDRPAPHGAARARRGDS